MKPRRLLAKGIEQFECWQSSGQPTDLDAAIASFSEVGAAEAVDADLRYWADALNVVALLERFQLTRAAADNDALIERLRRLVDRADPPSSDGTADTDTYRVVLGGALANRIEMYGQPGGPALVSDAEYLRELETAIDELAVAATSRSPLLTSVDRTEAAMLRARLLPKLVLARSMAGRKAGRLADIPELERVLRGLPDDHPNRAQLFLELGLAHLHLVLHPAAGQSSYSTSEHRAPAVRYLSTAVELLDPSYPERPNAIAFLSYLSFTRRPGSPDVPTGSPGELAARALDAPDLDPAVGAVIHLLAGTTAGPKSAPEDVAAAAAQLSQALVLARQLDDPAAPSWQAQGLPAAIAGIFHGLLSNPQATSPSLADRDAADAGGREFLAYMSESGLFD